MMKHSVNTLIHMLVHTPMRALVLSVALLFSLVPGVGYAQLSIEIFGAGTTQVPVAIAPFQGESGLPQEISKIISADLGNSKLFKLIESGHPNPALHETTVVSYTEWKNKGADALLTGSITKLADGRFDVRFRLLDTVKQINLGGLAYTATPALLRFTAHRIADFVYEKLLGEPGVFSTRMAYVTKQAGRFELQIADIDGQNPQTALVSREPIISPSWSPDGSRIAYVSFESRKPVIYVHNIATGQRVPVANFKGSNSAPAWSPDGKQLAVVLSRDSLQQIYLINADGSGLRRLTQSSGIDTDPTFTQDGRFVYFTSDRGGSPQVYRLPLASGEPTRVTFRGDYNVRARVSPDGTQLAYITRREGAYRLAIFDLSSNAERLLTETTNDDSPSFAPNGRFILYETKNGRADVLAMVSTDGRIRQSIRLNANAADTRDPTWGPFLKN